MQEAAVGSVKSIVEPFSPNQTATVSRLAPQGVTFRAFLIGLLLCAGLAALSNWVATLYNAHMLGGIQMPFGAIFLLLLLTLGVNKPLQALNRRAPSTTRFLGAFSAVELLTVYVMTMFGAMISAPGCDNQFMTMGPALFYYQSRENLWAKLFYQHIPAWMAPGWNGHIYQKDVVNAFYFGGLTYKQIPWHAWAVMLSAWSIFLLLTYAVLFFVSLLFRKQWIESEALAFPLVQLPLQMVDVEQNAQSPSGVNFWTNRTMWLGFALAAGIHFFKGMNSHYPDWPVFPVNQYGGYLFTFSDKPWNVITNITANLFLGGIGIAYLLTREVSLSFWFFFAFQQFQIVLAELLGFPTVGLEKSGVNPAPNFIIFQSIGGWVAMAAILVWTARSYLLHLFKQAFGANRADEEPFSPRFMVFGLIFSVIGLLAWSWFAGINLFFAFVFFSIFLLTSLVITRLVVEGGLMFPQPSYYAMDWMTKGMFGTAAMGAATVTKLSLIQPSILVDMRTNVLPGFLHTMKIAQELKLDRKGLRRLLLSATAAIIVALGVTLVTSLIAIYYKGGLQAYSWFTSDAPKATFGNAATIISTQPGLNRSNVIWTIVGAAVVWLMIAARSRFLWFPLHPLGYIAAASYPMTRLWFSFFMGWLIKSLVMKYGGSDTNAQVRPFMIGLILGNLAAMIFWMLIGFKAGSQTAYWPA